MNKPVEKYTNEDDFQQLAKWWQYRLGLERWQISFQYSTDADAINPDNDSFAYGMTYPDYVLRYAVVVVGDKGCLELTIVHELLHLLVPYSLLTLKELDESDDASIAFEANTIHRELEAMAKSLLMVKYPDIEWEYFKIDFEDFLKNTKEKFFEDKC